MNFKEVMKGKMPISNGMFLLLVFLAAFAGVCVGVIAAVDVTYDPAKSQLPVANVQTAIDALDANLDALPWKVDGSNVLYNAGNVGIGQTDPTQPLDVLGTIQSSDIRIKYPDSSESFRLYLSPESNNCWGGTPLSHLDGYILCVAAYK